MPLSFPSNPIAGQTTTQNGRTYSWSGYAWEFITQNVNSARSSLTTTSNTSNISVSGGYVPGYLDLFQNGSKLLSGSDYTATNGTSITLANSVPSGTTIEYITLLPSVNNNLYTKLDNISSSFNGSSTSFGLAVSGTAYYPVSANTLGIYVGGVAQEPIFAYSISGSNIVFTEAPASGLTFWGVGYGTTAVATLNGIVPGSSGSPAISSSNDLTTGFYFPSSGNISVAGNLGIGTSSPSTLLDVNSNKFRIRNSKTPSSPSDIGNQGDICWDSSYIYVCTSTNNWTRTRIESWIPVTSGMLMRLDASVIGSLYQSSDGSISATSTDNPVGYWADQSGLGNNAIQMTSGARPLLKLNNQNGLPGLYLNGTGEFITASVAGLQSLSAITVIMVVKTVSAALADFNAGIFCAFGNTGGASGPYPANVGFFLSHSAAALSGEYLTVGVEPFGSGGRLGSSSYRRSASQAVAIAVSLSASGTQVLQNNSAVTLDLASSVTTSTDSSPNQTGYTIDNDLHFGAIRALGSLAGFAAMTLHEVLVYNRALTSDERTRLWSYLSNKWGIS